MKVFDCINNVKINCNNIKFILHSILTIVSVENIPRLLRVFFVFFSSVSDYNNVFDIVPITKLNENQTNIKQMFKYWCNNAYNNTDHDSVGQ